MQGKKFADLSKNLRSYSLEKQIIQITKILGLSVTKNDFKEFYVIEKVMNNNFNLRDRLYIKHTLVIEILSNLKMYTNSLLKDSINFKSAELRHL